MKRNTAIIIVCLAGFLWASSGIAFQDVFRYAAGTEMELASIRLFSGGIILSIISMCNKRFFSSFKIVNENPKIWIEILFYSFLGMICTQLSYLNAVAIGGAATTTVITYTAPAIVILWQSIYNKALPHMNEAAAVIMAICGVFLLVTGGSFSQLVVPLSCIIFAFINASACAFNTIFPKHLFAKGIDPCFLLGIAMLIGGIIVQLVLVDNEKYKLLLQTEIMFDMFWIIIFGTVIAFAFFNIGLKYLSSVQTSVTSTVEPVASVIISWLVFGSTFGIIEMIGIILVVLAILAPTIIKNNCEHL